MVRAEYEVTTQRCPSCNTQIARHSSLFTHVEPVVRRCPKCNSEVVVTTCNEWELLTEKQRSIYNLRLMQSAVYRGMYVFLGAAALVWLLFEMGFVLRILRLLPPDFHRFIPLRSIFFSANHLVDGLSWGLVVLLIYEGILFKKHALTVRNSKHRMADQNYRDRVMAITRTASESA